MGGEQVDAVEVSTLGLDGDRRWGVVDLVSGKVLTARREPRLLFARARLVGDGVAVTLPDGTETESSDGLTRWLGREVLLTRAGDAGGIYENPRDFENESDWVSWQGPPGAWHDMSRARVSLVSTASLGDWDVRRFRPNVVLEGSGEDDLVGTTVVLGTCELSVQKQISRCVLVTRPQPGLDRDLEVLRTINRQRATFLAVGALVVQPGMVRVDDELRGGAALAHGAG